MADMVYMPNLWLCCLMTFVFGIVAKWLHFRGKIWYNATKTCEMEFCYAGNATKRSYNET